MFAFITLISINAIDGFWVSFFKFADQDLNHYLTMDEFTQAAERDPNWKDDAMDLKRLVEYNSESKPDDARNGAINIGLGQEDFFVYVRERMYGKSYHTSNTKQC